MKSSAKKFVCCIMAFLMAAFSFPQKANAFELEPVGEIFGFYQPAKYDWMSAPAEKTEEEVSEKLEKIRALAGSYFTANGLPCNPAPGSWVHGCSNCETTNLVNTNIFDLMPENRNCLPSYSLYNGTMSNICQSCAAFATMAHWYLYANESTDAVRTEKIASGVFNEETLSKAKPGDIIALCYTSTGRHYHSMIFIEHVAGGIRVIDNNWGTPTYGNCYVMERTANYSSKYYAVISRAENFNEGEIAATGVEISGDEVITLIKGEEKQLSAKVEPEDATDKTVAWSTSDPAVAQISPEGILKAVGIGTAEITVTTNDGGFADTCTVEVTERVFTVSYNANGGENAPESQSKTEGEDITISEEIPARAGYSFLGWASSADAEEPEYQPGETYSADADITLFALWQKITYTVSYNANGGSAAPAKQTKNYGEPLVLSETMPFRAGYVFLGWASSADAEEPEYQPGETYSADADITLFALWQKITYTVSYNANGGSAAPAKQIKYYGEPLVLSEAMPFRAGYVFLGWASSADAEKPEYQPGETYDINENITLYAVWGKNSEGILYGDADGNGKVNVLDANLIRRYAAKLIELDENQAKAADVSGDGKVNILDANLIRRYAARLVDKFPVET